MSTQHRQANSEILDLYYYVSPTASPRAKPFEFRFVSAHDIHNARGFRSVYAYDKRTVDRVVRQGHMRGLQGTTVYALDFVVDFDNAETEARTFCDNLQTHDVSYVAYTSGNRSIHVHVEREPQSGPQLGRMDRMFAQRFVPGADTTIYNPVGLYRLPGTWHEKNPGHQKQVIELYKGDSKLCITNHTTTARHPVSNPNTNKRTSLKFAIKDRVYAGGRRCHVWRIATLAYDSGLDYSTALSYAKSWNTECAVPPLELHVVEQKVYEAYQQRIYTGA